MKKSELWELNIGDRVVFKKKSVKFWEDKAFDMTARAGKVHETDQDEYFIRRAIGQGMPYDAVVVDLLEDVEMNGKKVPGARLELRVGSLTDTTIVSHKDIRRV